LKFKIGIDVLGKKSVSEVNVPDSEHLRIQETYKAQVFENKKKVIPRHQKYKYVNFDE